jgi:hypothetical protein
MEIVSEIYDEEIPLECGCAIMSNAIHRPTPDMRIPTCKNKVSRVIRLNNGEHIFCCARHVQTHRRSVFSSSMYLDTLKRQSVNSKVFIELPPIIPAIKKIKVLKKDYKFVLSFAKNQCQNECSICMENVLPTNGGHLTCNHSFHNECITNWFIKNKNTCPYCRTKCNTKSFKV